MVCAEPLLLVLNADGTLSGCSLSQRVLSTLWTVPGTHAAITDHHEMGCRALHKVLDLSVRVLNTLVFDNYI